MRHARPGVVLAAAAALLVPPPAAGQSPHVLAGWADDRLAVFGGLEWVYVPTVIVLPGEGEQGENTWNLYFEVGAGVTIDFDPSEVDPAAFGLAAVQWRLGGGLEPRLGIGGIGLVNPGAGGPIVRLEAGNVAVIDAGWVWGGGGRNGPLVLVELDFAIFRDTSR